MIITFLDGSKKEFEVGSSALDIAKAIKVKRDLNLKGGVLISNPIKEEDSYPSEEINKVIDERLKNQRELLEEKNKSFYCHEHDLYINTLKNCVLNPETVKEQGKDLKIVYLSELIKE